VVDRKVRNLGLMKRAENLRSQGNPESPEKIRAPRE
jgi:hypothetical protein